MRFSNPKCTKLDALDGEMELSSPSPRTAPYSWPFEPRTQHTHILVPGAAFDCVSVLIVLTLTDLGAHRVLAAGILPFYLS